MKNILFLGTIFACTVGFNTTQVIAAPEQPRNSQINPVSQSLLVTQSIPDSNIKPANTQSKWTSLRLVYTLDAKSKTDAQNIPKEFISFIHGRSAYPIAISPDGNLLASAGLTEIKLWNLQTGQEIASPLAVTKGITPAGIQSVAFSPDGQLLVTASGARFFEQKTSRGSTKGVSIGGVVQVWDVSTRNLLGSLKGALFGVQAQINSFGQLIYSTDKIVVLKLNGKQPFSFPTLSNFEDQSNEVTNFADRVDHAVQQFRPESSSISIPEGSLSFGSFNFTNQNFAIIPNKSILAIAETIFGIEFRDLTNGKLLGKLSTTNNSVNSRGRITVSPDGVMFAASDENNLIKIINFQNAQSEIKKFTADHKGEITFMVFTPDHQVLATGGEDKTIKLWDVQTGTLLKTINVHEDRITCLVFSPDGKTFVSSGMDAKIRIWQI